MTKKLDLNSGSFTANGSNYKIATEIPLSRYIEFKKLHPRLVYGMDHETLAKNLIKAFTFLNSPKPEPANAAIIIHNIISGIKDIDDPSREDPALMICALIIIKDGEDVGTYDKELCISKIRDWEKEGYEPDSFFELALISLKNFKKTFELFMSHQEKVA